MSAGFLDGLRTIVIGPQRATAAAAARTDDGGASFSERDGDAAAGASRGAGNDRDTTT